MGRLSPQKELVFKVSRCPGCLERAASPPGVSVSPPRHEEHDFHCPRCKAAKGLLGGLGYRHRGKQGKWPLSQLWPPQQKGLLRSPLWAPPNQFLQPHGSGQLLGHTSGGWHPLGKGLVEKAPQLHSHQLPQELGMQGAFQKLA